MFVAITLIAIVVWRVNQRYQLRNNAKKIQDSGAEVVYHWQQPTVVADALWVVPAYSLRPRPITRLRPDGTTWTSTVSSSLDSTTQIPFSTNTINRGIKNKSAPGPLTAQWHLDNDITVSAIVVDEDKVDSKFVAALADFSDLKTVQIRRNRRYFQLAVCRPNIYNVSSEVLKTELAKHREPFAKASSMISQRLPAVKIIEGKME